MMKYEIKSLNKDFSFLKSQPVLKGSRVKRLAFDGKKYAIFKYDHPDYNVSEISSEKMSYEIAKVIGFDCARIELAKDENGKIGVLNYLFTNKDCEHSDIISYLNDNILNRKEFYTLSNIKKVLDGLNPMLFSGFIGIMIFDALVGETDRHEENWGILKYQDYYQISPLYDNGCNLLREFKDESFAEKKIINFENYIMKSSTCIYKENGHGKYKHFELIEILNQEYFEIVQQYLLKVKCLQNQKIKNIVFSIPNNLLTIKHKEYIIMYLIQRRDILLKMLEVSDENEE